MAKHSVRIDKKLYLQAVAAGKAETRTAPQQVEHWVKLGKLAEENPKLTSQDIMELLHAEAVA